MTVTEQRIGRVKRDRNANRVEAWVHLDVSYHPRVPARRVTVLASVAARGPGRLRERLMREAERVAHTLHRPRRMV